MEPDDWSRQRLSAVYRVKDYLGQGGLTIAFKSFVRLVVSFLWVSLPLICTNWILFTGWQRDCLMSPFHHWPLLCKLQNLRCPGLLQQFCPILTLVTHAYSFRHAIDDSLALKWLTKYNSLDLFINSFLGTIPSIWNTIPPTLQERGVIEGWSTLCHLLQRHYWQSMLIILCIVFRHHTCLCVHCIWCINKKKVINTLFCT